MQGKKILTVPALGMAVFIMGSSVSAEIGGTGGSVDLTDPSSPIVTSTTAPGWDKTVTVDGYELTFNNPEYFILPDGTYVDPCEWNGEDYSIWTTVAYSICVDYPENENPYGNPLHLKDVFADAPTYSGTTAVGAKTTTVDLAELEFAFYANTGLCFTDDCTLFIIPWGANLGGTYTYLQVWTEGDTRKPQDHVDHIEYSLTGYRTSLVTDSTIPVPKAYVTRIDGGYNIKFRNKLSWNPDVDDAQDYAYAIYYEGKCLEYFAKCEKAINGLFEKYGSSTVKVWAKDENGHYSEPLTFIPEEAVWEPNFVYDSETGILTWDDPKELGFAPQEELAAGGSGWHCITQYRIMTADGAVISSPCSVYSCENHDYSSGKWNGIDKANINVFRQLINAAIKGGNVTGLSAIYIQPEYVDNWNGSVSFLYDPVAYTLPSPFEGGALDESLDSPVLKPLSETSFSWEPVQNAAGYIVDFSRNDGMGYTGYYSPDNTLFTDGAIAEYGGTLSVYAYDSKGNYSPAAVITAEELSYYASHKAQVVTAPVGNALSFTGGEQELVTAGVALNGEMVYSLDGVSFSAAIPTASEAGEYTVHYKAKGESDLLDSDIGTVTAAITVTYMKGDMNSDGYIDENDIDALLMYYLMPDFFQGGEDLEKIADFDENGYVDEADIDALLMYYLLGW